MSAESFHRVAVYDGDLTQKTPALLEGWTVLSIHRYAGGRHDYAVFRRELAQQEETLENMRIDGHIATNEQPQYVTVWRLNNLGTRVVPLFWGQLLKPEFHIGPLDQETAVAMVVDHHFGEPLRGQYVWSLDDAQALTVHLDPVFNPLVDGRIEPNMQGLLTADGSPGQRETVPYHLWIDPESSRTAEAIAQRGETEGTAVDFWTLREALKTLCEWLTGNPVINRQIKPPKESAAAWTGYSRIDDSLVIYNQRLKRGSYLPDLLDTLLPPFKYNWFVKLHAKGGGIEDEPTYPEPRIEFFPTDGKPRDEFPAKTLKRQAAGEKYNKNLSHVISARIIGDLSHLANRIECYGSLKAREFTIPLFRAWPSSADTGADYTLDGANPTAWRKWVANEGGDYEGLRTEITTAIDLNSELFGEANFNYTIPKRREIEEPLKWRSGSEDFHRQPVHLEYSLDAGDTWAAVPSEWGWTLLPNEIGVMFTGETVPPDLFAAGADAQLRITGTVAGDRRIHSVATRATSSPLVEEIVRLIDVSDRFHDRQISNDLYYGSQLATGTDTGDDIDDQDELDAFTERLRDENDHALVAVQAVLWGLRTEYEIGDILEKIAGKELSLASRSESAGEPRYPQIKELHWDYFGQTTTVVAST